MTMRRHHLIVFGLAAAAAVAAAACSEEAPGPGIAVSVDLAQFAPDARILRISFSANGGGFVAQTRGNVDGVGVTTEDLDGDGALELVTEFFNPGASISFRVETGNQTPLTVSAQALAFNDSTIIAGADSDPAGTALPVGGRASIALTLAERTGGVIGPDTRTTDIKTVAPDIAVNTAALAHFSAVAVCDADGDGTQDLVLGAPETEYLLGSVGAVYVVFGTNGLGSAIDFGDATTLMEFHFFGENPGDQLGASLACADLNGDDIGDLIVGAPGAGRVYAVFGGLDLPMRKVTPGTTGDTSPDVTWVSAAGGSFGAKLIAAELDGDKSAEILVSAPGSMKVHLLAGVDRPIAAPIDVDGTDHVTFSNVVATSLAMGDLTRSGAADVIIGDAEAKMVNSTISRGVVYGFPSVMLDGTTQYDVHATDAVGPGLVMFGGEDMQFGAAVLALDTTGGGQDLIVGAPGANDAAGAFYLYEGDSAFFEVKMRDYLENDAVKLGPIANGRFGAALAGTPSGTAPSYSKWDLLVGAYTTSRGDGRPLVGAAYLFGGGPGWPFPLYEQVFGAESGDQLGAVVAGGQVNPGDTVGDLVMIAPFAQFGGAASGAVYVRFNHYVR
jgi:hypothetical protein